jgi:hypothetical protein
LFVHVHQVFMDVVVNFVIIVNPIHGKKQKIFEIKKFLVKMILCFLVIIVVLVLRQQMLIYVNVRFLIRVVIVNWQ